MLPTLLTVDYPLGEDVCEIGYKKLYFKQLPKRVNYF